MKDEENHRLAELHISPERAKKGKNNKGFLVYKN